MRFLRTHATTIAICVTVSSLTMAAPSVAAGVVKFAKKAGNSQKVDGLDAVRANAKIKKGKLVATDPATGLLPAEILGKVLDTERFDGLDSSEFLRSAPDSITGGFVNEATLGQVPSAMTAGSAATALSASSALSAATATRADGALSALRADFALRAAAADRADAATHAQSADTATKATSADQALHATTATSAGRADTADRASSAIAADSATRADAARHADTAARSEVAARADSLGGFSAGELVRIGVGSFSGAGDGSLNLAGDTPESRTATITFTPPRDGVVNVSFSCWLDPAPNSPMRAQANMRVDQPGAAPAIASSVNFFEDVSSTQFGTLVAQRAAGVDGGTPATFTAKVSDVDSVPDGECLAPQFLIIYSGIDQDGMPHVY